MSDANLKSTQEVAEQGEAAMSAATHNFQAFAAECAEMSRQSLEHAANTVDKLRAARGVSEVLAIQTDYLRRAFENFTQHSRRFAELMAALPMELSKNYADVWTKSVHSAADASREAGEKLPSNVEKFTKAP